jgi:hypothetical protein
MEFVFLLCSTFFLYKGFDNFPAKSAKSEAILEENLSINWGFPGDTFAVIQPAAPLRWNSC